MAAIAPTPVDPAPSVPDSSLEEPTFDAQFEAFLTWLAEDAAPGFDALAQNAYDNAVLAEAAVGDSEAAQTAAELAQAAAEAAQVLAEAAESTATSAAGTATTQAGISTTQAGIATTQAGIATTQAGLAATAKTGAETAQGLSEGARDAAEAFRDQAEIFATQQLVGSSTTPNTVGVGLKTFMMEPGRAFVYGMYVVASSGDGRIAGSIYSYNQSTGELQISSDAFGGSGSYSDWAIGVAVAGQVGGITTQRVSINTTCVANVRYLVAAAGITLTLPATYTAADKQDFVEEIGNGATWTLDFNGHKLRSQTMGAEIVQADFAAVAWSYFDATGGLE